MNQMTDKEAWALLQISPGSSKREIRRAYAELAKECHPEENPEAFARLQEAYQHALGAAGREPQGNPESEKRTESITLTAPTKQIASSQPVLEAEPSLLERLRQQEDIQIEKSLSKGALGTLQTLLQDKTDQKKTDTWKEFFLSEEFLTEQLQISFLKGLSRFLRRMGSIGYEEKEQPGLPWQFVAELMLAYGIVPEEEAFLSNGISEELQVIADTWWSQEEDSQERILSYLEKPQNQVRLRAFSDYLTMKNWNRQGYLTTQGKDHWETIVRKGEKSYFYERNGGQFTAYSRSECIVTLYTHWIRTEEVPSCICQFMYQKYQLKDLEHSSNKALYQGLRAAILEKYPKIEEELFGEEGKIQQISRWYRDLMQIVTEYHNRYEKRSYEEPEDLQDKIRALLKREEWNRYCYDAELFDKMYLQLANRKVLPPMLAKELYVFYSGENDGKEGSAWKEVAGLEEKLSVLQETMVRSLAFHRMLLEQDYRKPYLYQGIHIEEITSDNQAFWTYYLMNGFGARYIERIGSSDNQAEYVRWNRYYLPAYIRSVYLPSAEWAKCFTGFDEEEMAIPRPVRKEVPFPACEKAPMGGMLQVEFHLHYVTYQLDGIPVIEPLLSWRELFSQAQKTEEPELFFFWLAVTAIRQEERKEAKNVIEQYLKKLPLAPSTRDLIAEALAADNARTEQPEKLERRVQAVFYQEQERFCFKVEVYLRGIKLYRQTDFGWEETTLLPGEGKQAKALDLEGKKQFAVEKLQRMRQPKSRLIKTVLLEDGQTDNLQKAIQIIEGLKEQEQYSKERTKAYMPGFPWNPENITPPVREFFAAYGGWMTEAFVVLHIGWQPKKCFDRIYYSAMNIFGFDLYFHSPEHSRSLRFRESELERKIKEKHLIVGRLGWGEEYEALGGYAPIPFAIGESGCFYAYDGLHLIRKPTFPELVAGCYDFTNITRMDLYDARLTVSKLDQRLEYCYTKTDYETWLNHKGPIIEEMFTKFGI
ncbi:MAG: J domain-containing protein [Lachnospiraceae bacterium]|nr:J domain-containing protein [Lachnospiraceae bacterium]